MSARLSAQRRLSGSALLTTFVTVTASANDTNYQNYVVGERALGLGGAFTALADDASGAYYNPAGLALVPASGLSASLNIYGVEKQKRTRAYTEEIDLTQVSVDLEDTPVATIPTTVGLVRKFGGKLSDGISRHAIGFSTYVPYATSFSGGAALQGPVSQGHYVVTESDKTIWTGPTYAMRLNRQWSVGAAIFYSYRFASRKWESSVEQELPGTTLSSQFAINNSSVEWSSGEIFGRVGVRYDPTSRWSLGLAASTPSAHIHGGADLFELRVLATASDSPGEDDLSYIAREATDAPTRNALAPEVRAGLAYRSKRRWMLSLDVSLHLAVEFDPVDIRSIPEAERPIAREHVDTVVRNTVVNANIGGEYFVAERVPIRGGFLTNFATSPDVQISNEAQLQHVDMYGATTSVGYASDEVEISVGVLYSFGRGKGAAWNDSQYVPQPVRNDFVYFYISGAQKALAKVATQLVGSENKSAPGPSKPVESPAE